MDWINILFVITVLVAVPIHIRHFTTRRRVFKYAEHNPNYREGEKYIAVLIGYPKRFDKILTLFFGISSLIEHMENQGCNHKILNDAKEKELRNVIDDQNCFGIYLIGHGCRHGWRVSKEKIAYYCEFKDAPKKEFVVQLHCNDGGGESLVQILVENEDTRSYAGDKKMFTTKMDKFLRNQCKENLDLKCH